ADPGGRLVHGTEVRCGDSLLWVHTPVDDVDQRLHHILDDQGTTGGTEDHLEFTDVTIVAGGEDQGGGHGGAWSFRRLHTVGHRLTVLIHRFCREVRQLVVEDETAGEVEGTEGGLDTGGQGGGIAIGVDDGDMAGAALRDRGSDGDIIKAGLGCAHGGLFVDKLGASLRVLPADQLLDTTARYVHEGWVGDVGVAVGV